MNEEKEVKINKKLLDYSRELVMLNYVYERKLLTKEEMLIVKRKIEEDYGVKGEWQ